MTLLSRFRSWLRAIVRRSRMEREMDVELRFHIEAFAEDLVRSGVPRQEAMRRARIEFGGMERTKEECREARGTNFLESLSMIFATACARCVRIRDLPLWPFSPWLWESAPTRPSSAL